MIRPFVRTDLALLVPNQFSSIKDFGWTMDDPEFYKHTLVDNGTGEVKAIMCFKRYWGNCWAAFVLVSETFSLPHGRELKEFFWQAVEDFGAERVQTDSVACRKLDLWHRFLGFTLEGTRRKMIYGQDYNMWGWCRGN